MRSVNEVMSFDAALSGLAEFISPPDGSPSVLCISGPHGSGKSSLLEQSQLDVPILGSRPQFDAQMIKLSLSNKVPARSRAAHLLEEALIAHFTENPTSFIWETTLAGASGRQVQNIRELRAKGYKSVAFCVQIASHKLGASRLGQRFDALGMTVSVNEIKNSWEKNLENTAELLRAVDFALVFENSVSHTPLSLIAGCRGGRTTWKSNRCPEYVDRLLPPMIDL